MILFQQKPKDDYDDYEDDFEVCADKKNYLIFIVDTLIMMMLMMMIMMVMMMMMTMMMMMMTMIVDTL